MQCLATNCRAEKRARGYRHHHNGPDGEKAIPGAVTPGVPAATDDIHHTVAICARTCDHVPHTQQFHRDQSQVKEKAM